VVLGAGAVGAGAVAFAAVTVVAFGAEAAEAAAIGAEAAEAADAEADAGVGLLDGCSEAEPFFIAGPASTAAGTVAAGALLGAWTCV
jgi:hypothetical protein